MSRRPVMTAEQWAEFQTIEAKQNAWFTSQANPQPTLAELDRYRVLRQLVPPPQALAAGSPCTYTIGSDRYPGTVFLNQKGARLIMAEIKGLGLMEFTYRPSDGSYREKGIPCGRLTLGVAYEHYSREY